jgi:beta-glucanase (GH16 family)
LILIDNLIIPTVGRLPRAIYSNIFALNQLDYGQGQTHDTVTETHDNWHDLTIDWQPDYIRWLIDGRVVRTLLKNETFRAEYRGFLVPTEESRISFSIWDGGQGAEGTAEWAGTPTNWRVYRESVWLGLILDLTFSGSI